MNYLNSLGHNYKHNVRNNLLLFSFIIVSIYLFFWLIIIITDINTQYRVTEHPWSYNL